MGTRETGSDDEPSLDSEESVDTLLTYFWKRTGDWVFFEVFTIDTTVLEVLILIGVLVITYISTK